MRGVAVLLLVTLLAACDRESKPRTIDGSSAEAFARTAEAARQTLPIAERLDFDRAIATVPARRYGNRDAAAAARIAFDGMTAKEVVANERERTNGRR